jgi:ABC-type nickel/cobalt efflux system permease component RcnA
MKALLISTFAIAVGISLTVVPHTAFAQKSQQACFEKCSKKCEMANRRANCMTTCQANCQSGAK